MIIAPLPRNMLFLFACSLIAAAGAGFANIDEPQSVDNTPKAKEAIDSLKPMCVLRYSATHREKINLLYRLTPVDAYQMGLVKQICVSSNRAENDFMGTSVRVVNATAEGI